jgi:hypothetical protein
MGDRRNDAPGTPPDGTPDAGRSGAPAPERRDPDAGVPSHPRRPSIGDRDASINTDIYRNPNRELPA